MTFNMNTIAYFSLECRMNLFMYRNRLQVKCWGYNWNNKRITKAYYPSKRPPWIDVSRQIVFDYILTVKLICYYVNYSSLNFIDIQPATVSVWYMKMQPIVILVIKQLVHIRLLQPSHVIVPFAICINAKSFHLISSSILK